MEKFITLEYYLIQTGIILLMYLIMAVQMSRNFVKTHRKHRNAINRAVDKIHNFEGHKRTVESIRNELMGGGE